MPLGSIATRAKQRARTLPERHGGPAILVAVALVVALGFGLRLEAALNPNLDPGDATIVAYQGNDSKSYADIAESLYETGRYGTPEMNNPTDWSPGAPIFYAGVYYVTGGVHPDLARGAVAILGALMVLFVYLLGRRLAGPGVGVGAALLAAIYPAFIDNAEQFVSEPIAAFTLSGAVLATFWAADPGRRTWAWLLPGALLGATALTRPEYLIFAGILGLVVLVKMARDRGIRPGVASAALFVAAFAIVLAPWTVRNFIVLDKFVPVTTGGGKALFVATYLPGDGRQLRVKRELIRRFEHKQEVTDREVADTQMKDLLDKVARKYPDLPRDAALAKIGRENFRKYVREDPVAYAGMVVTKMWNVWRRGSGPTMRASGWIAFHYAILALAILGLTVLAWRRRWEVLVIGLLILGITVLGGLLLAVPRRNVPLMPLVLTLAACGGAWLSLAVGTWLAKRRGGGRRTVGRRSRLTTTAVVLVAVVVCALVPQAASAQVTERLPDLVADPPSRPVLQTYSRPGQANQLLLRFEGYVHNRGAGALEVRGAGPAGGRMSSAVQRIYRSDGTWSDDGTRNVQMLWEAEDGHDHWHIKHAARYSLWSADRAAMVAPAMKVGFCLIDSQHVDSHGPGSRVYTVADNDFCAQGRPQVPSLVEGVSAGWRDVYVRDLAFQWVNVSDVQPGTYWLRADADPDNWARESNESNAAAYASSMSTIPGYVARAVDAGIISSTAPTHIRLATAAYGSNLGSPEFRITAPPRHGRLSRAVGAPFQGGDVVYTPDPGWLGPDRFTYEARDGTSEFPRYPTSAAATVAVGGMTPAVAISGAPASMYTRTSARLTAQLLRTEGVTWTVNGIPGGSPAVGTIDKTGLYVAPARVPPGGQVTIRATTASGAWEEVTIAIVWAPTARPAPAPRARLAMKVRGTTNLYGIRIAAQDGALLIRARSRRAGILRVRARHGKKALGRCRARTRARHGVTCKIRLRGVRPTGVRVVISLNARGKLLDVRRVSLRGLRHDMH